MVQLCQEAHRNPLVQRTLWCELLSQGPRALQRARQRPQAVMRLLPRAVHKRGLRQALRVQVEAHHSLHGLPARSRPAQVLAHHQFQVCHRLHLLHVQLCEAVPQPGRQVLLSNIGGRVHAGKDAEVLVARHGFDVSDLV